MAITYCFHAIKRPTRAITKPVIVYPVIAPAEEKPEPPSALCPAGDAAAVVVAVAAELEDIEIDDWAAISVATVFATSNELAGQEQEEGTEIVIAVSEHSRTNI